MEAPEHGEGCPEAVGLHGKAAAEALQSGAERVRKELQVWRTPLGSFRPMFKALNAYFQCMFKGSKA